MATLVFVIFCVIVGLVLASFVLAHFGFVVLLAIGLWLFGRHMRRHGV